MAGLRGLVLPGRSCRCAPSEPDWGAWPRSLRKHIDGEADAGINCVRPVPCFAPAAGAPGARQTENGVFISSSPKLLAVNSCHR